MHEIVPPTVSKVAVHVRAAFMVTEPSVQSASPLQPAKTDPATATALRVTFVPPRYGSEQSAPHVMPVGFEVIVPEDPPFSVFDTESVCESTVNVAVTFRASVIVTTHAPEPEHAPPQLENEYPPLGVGVSTTAVPYAYDSEQSAPAEPQLMPTGFEVMVPFVADVVSI